MSRPTIRSRRTIMAGGLVLILMFTGALVALTWQSGTRVTAYFGQAVGVYSGSDLRVLGVKVGTVDSIRPEGRQVRVTMTIDHGVAVPAGAVAVAVAPSVVADRYIQLSPAYTSGPRLRDHAVIPATRTATPVEIDQLYASISRLATALGPNGANRKGALSDALDAGAANLAGNGKDIGDLIDDFGQATKTLSGSENDLFATLTNLQKFTTMLKANDGQVRLAEQQLSQVTGFLSDDRQNLGAALQELATALGEIQRFIHDNRARLKSNVTKLASITQILVNQRRSLAEVLDTAPLAADNVLNAYDPVNQTLDGRGDLNELSMGGPLTTASAPAAGGRLCSLTGAAKKLASLCEKYAKGSAGLTPVPSSRRPSLPPLPLPPVGDVYGTGGR
ncbi:MCE family protein [Actinomadura sp. DC4]|uniref:MCE family protein n=1 Tax=Actinomadura sp. DC4 TaxID=3055069 RepID=UPI0025B13E46|nr:MCE family protein [Actinomadura sp. DC4]MDN3357843.1 MCE family protein [Actinomadura sp. DC4]